MCDHGACRGAGQLLGPSTPQVESLQRGVVVGQILVVWLWSPPSSTPSQILDPPRPFKCWVLSPLLHKVTLLGRGGSGSSPDQQ